MFRDFGIFTYPNAFFQHESFWRGEFPLWNPLNNCGIPFLAQWNTVCLYPLSLIYILLPLTWGMTLFLLSHLFLAGFGMYFLGSHWSGNRLAGAVAGVAFAFNGMTLNCLMWSSNLAALAWMPLVILLVEKAFLMGGGAAANHHRGTSKCLSNAGRRSRNNYFYMAGFVCAVDWANDLRQATPAENFYEHPFYFGRHNPVERRTTFAIFGFAQSFGADEFLRHKHLVNSTLGLG